MKTILILMSLTLAGNLMAADHHALGAHEHGSIKIEMAVEDYEVEIDIDGPAESFLGFEYQPKTPKEKKLLLDLHSRWTKKLSQYIAFDPSIECVVESASFIRVGEGNHSDIEAKAKLKCKKSLFGRNVTISLKKEFPNIKKLSVEILSKTTKSIDITMPVQTLKI